MSLYYDVNSAPALKNLNMTIEPGMKVGIVGRFVAIISSRFFLPLAQTVPVGKWMEMKMTFALCGEFSEKFFFARSGQSRSGALELEERNLKIFF